MGAGGLDVLLLVLDSAGSVGRELAFGGARDDAGHWITDVSTGGYVIAGYTLSFGAGRKDVYLVRLNQTGETLWTRTYGGALEDCSYDVRETRDSGFVVVGYRDGPSGWTKGDLWVIRTDALGETLWTRTFGGAGQEFASSVIPLADGGFAVAGQTASFGSGGYDAWLLRLDALGDTLWTRRWGGTQDDVVYELAPAAAGGWLLAGYADGTPPWTPGDLWLARVDSAGDTLWTRRWGGSGPDVASAALATGDGWLAAGSTGAAGAEDLWFVRTDAGGDSLWTLRVGGTATDAAIGLCPAPTGGWLCVGYTMSYGAGGPNVYVVKTTVDTAGAVNESPPVTGSQRARVTIRRLTVRMADFGEEPLVDVCGRRVAGIRRHGIYFARDGDGRSWKTVRVR